MLGIEPSGRETLDDLYKLLLEVLSLEEEIEKIIRETSIPALVPRALQQRWMQHLRNLITTSFRCLNKNELILYQNSFTFNTIALFKKLIADSNVEWTYSKIREPESLKFEKKYFTAIFKICNLHSLILPEEKVPELIISEQKEENINPQWLIPIPVSASLNGIWKKPGANQLEWGKKWRHVMDKAAQALETKAPIAKSSQDFHSFLAEERASVATDLKQDCKIYGVSRSEDLKGDVCIIANEYIELKPGSRFCSQYSLLKERFAENLFKKLEHKTTDTYSETGYYIHGKNKRGYSADHYWIDGEYMKASGEVYKAALIEVVFISIEGYRTDDKEYLFEDWDTRYMITAHMPAQRIDDFERAQNKLHQDLLNSKGKVSQAVLYEKLAKSLHRTFCFMPFRGGTAAVGEAELRAHEIINKMELKRFKGEETIDMVAMLSDEKDYVRSFPNFFAGSSPITDACAQGNKFSLKLDARWESLKATKGFNPQNRGLVFFSHSETPLPILKNPTTERVSYLRPRSQMIGINWRGSEENTRQENLFAEIRLKKLIERNRLDSGKLAILKGMEEFIAIYLEINKNFYHDPSYVAVEAVENFLRHKSFAEIEKIINDYRENMLKINWIESLPAADFNHMHQVISSQERLNSLTLDELKSLANESSPKLQHPLII